MKKKAGKKKTTKEVAKKKVAKKRKVSAKKKDMVIQSPVDPKAQIVMASEIADDSLIEAELMGEVLACYIYEFQQNGKPVRGLSVKGVNEVVRRVNRNKRSGYKITLPPESLKIERDVEYDGVKGVEVSVMAVNLIDGTNGYGIKFEAYKKKGRNGSYENTFAVEKALSKAERNAKRKLIPEPVAVKMIQKMIEESPDTVKKLEPATVVYEVVTQEKQLTPEDQFKTASHMIKGLRDVPTLLEIEKRCAESKIYSKAQKNQLNNVIHDRIEEIKNS